jgi:hypothetical protein
LSPLDVAGQHIFIEYAPMMPQAVQTMRGPKAATGVASSNPSTLITALRRGRNRADSGPPHGVAAGPH